MKNLSAIIIATAFLAACGEPDKKAQLEDLKKQQAEIASQISTLEKEIAASGVKEEFKGKIVSAIPIVKSTFTHFVEVQGMVDADENVAVSPEMPGVVTKVFVSVGQTVSKGQPLAEMNNSAMKQQIQALQSQLDLARTAYEKQKTLWDKKIGTEMQYLQSKTQKEALEKQIAAMKDQSDMAIINSPIDGVVDAVNAKVGQMSAPGMPAFQVVNLSGLKVKGQVPEKYAAQVKTGSEVMLFFPDIKKEVKGTVSYSAKVINTLSRTFGVEVKLSEGGDFHPNMIAILKIADYKKDSSLIVPTDVVQHSENSTFVFVGVKDGNVAKVHKRVVTVGNSYGGNTEILSGLKEGEQLITKGYQGLNEGDEIKF